MTAITGGDGKDAILGGAGADDIRGHGGDDMLEGLSGADSLDGGSGNDTIFGGSNGDLLKGGAGDDLIHGDGLDGRDGRLLAMVDNRPGFGSWGLLYQGPQYGQAALEQAPHGMLIINAARYSGVDGKEVLWTRTEIDAIQSHGQGKVLFGYLSTSKINTYMTQWQAGWTANGDASGTLTASGAQVPWLGAVDVQFPGTREVNYWDAGWREVMFARIDMMIGQGFDGTLLDDVGEFFERRLEGLTPGTAAFTAQVRQNAIAMRDLVIAIRDHADASMAARLGISPGALTDDNRFQLYVNGGPYVISDALQAPSLAAAAADPASQRYLHAIDGILAENWFGPGGGAVVADVIAMYGANGVTLLSVDTLNAGAQTLVNALNAGFMPYVTAPDYDRLSDPFPIAIAGLDAGGDGNDTIDAGPGNDTIDGGGGIDLLLLTGGIGDYAVRRAPDGYEIVSAAEIKHVANIEQVTFDGAGVLTMAAFEARAFNGYKYLAGYADLRAAFHVDTDAAWEHYLRYGKAEGRDPNLFDARLYLASNPDLIRAFGADEIAAAQHFTYYGVKEGRPLNSFDALRYAALNPDLKAAFGADIDKLITHYLQYGFKENRPAGDGPHAQAMQAPDVELLGQPAADAADPLFI